MTNIDALNKEKYRKLHKQQIYDNNISYTKKYKYFDTTI